jgi:glycosyltransferase involved in cell wall biosynthesis
MLILHIISNEDDRARAERVTRYLPETFEHQYVTPNELATFQGGADVIHAHRWFECGQAACAYAAAKRLPYTVDVMQGDIEAYRKLFVFNRKSAENILLEAARVIFTSPSQQDFLAQHLPSKTADSVFFHSTLIYEALNPFWISNIHIHPPTALVHIKLLSVGTSESNSHLDVVHHAMKKLQRRNYDISLTTVDDLTDEELLGVYRNHDIMLLLDEKTHSTQRFAEALSQGLPVLYAPNSICDGIFKEGLAGYTVNPKSSDDLARTILDVSDLFGTIEQHISRLHPLALFDAKEQARQWEHLYENALR